MDTAAAGSAIPAVAAGIAHERPEARTPPIAPAIDTAMYMAEEFSATGRPERVRSADRRRCCCGPVMAQAAQPNGNERWHATLRTALCEGTGVLTVFDVLAARLSEPDYRGRGGPCHRRGPPGQHESRTYRGLTTGSSCAGGCVGTRRLADGPAPPAPIVRLPLVRPASNQHRDRAGPGGPGAARQAKHSGHSRACRAWRAGRAPSGASDPPARPPSERPRGRAGRRGRSTCASWR